MGGKTVAKSRFTRIMLSLKSGNQVEVFLCLLLLCTSKISRGNISFEGFSNETRNSLTMVILMPASTPLVGHPSAVTSGGAVSLALNMAEENGLLSDVNLSVIWKNTECSESEALGKSVKLHMRHQVDVFIGPACHPGDVPLNFF